MKKMVLAKNLTLPLIEAVTQTVAILGKRGSGKTTTATVFVEELLEAGQHVVIIDPLDVTWGLRSTRDGKGVGYPITVLGGDHADLPLEASAGSVIADFVVGHHAPLILSLRHFSMNDQRRFVTDFAERLYALKGKQENRTALHLVIDEVDEFAAQRIPPGHERMFGAIDRLVRRGRSAGIGVTMISQRAAVIHKDILSQAEVLVCHQTISPQDRKALDAWIQSHDAKDQRADFMASIAGLQRGEAWVWSPGWLDIFQRVQIRDRTTFDSSATPKAGQQAEAPKALAKVDLEQLSKQIATTIEKQKADDPKELRKQIASLQRELTQAQKVTPRVQQASAPAITEEDRRIIRELATALTASKSRADERLRNAADGIPNSIKAAINSHIDTIKQLELMAAEDVADILTEARFADVLAKLDRVGSVTPANTGAPRSGKNGANYSGFITKPSQPTQPKADSRKPQVVTDGLTEPEQRILDSLSWWKGSGIERPSRRQVSFGARYTLNGHFNNTLGGLRTKGLIDYPSPGAVALTSEGANLAAEPDGAVSRADLIARSLEVLRDEPQRRVFKAVADAGQTIERAALAAACNYTVNGHFNNTLGSLRSLGLIDYPGRGLVSLSEMFDL